MDNFFCKALLVILTVSASVMTVKTTTLAEDLSVTKQSTNSPIDTEEHYSLVDVKREQVPEVMVSDETPVSQLTAEPATRDTQAEPALENPLEPKPLEDSTAMEQVTSVSKLADVQPT
ncbi:MAG TPA: hypothetical protein V6D26_22420, partial [Stenomitos sp.]